ncbi:hypothetical protein [Pseudonocardia humida]|uniref:Uncharacterized protein n=1 Tax=Pseudonocardia humida TaxID=2800819 RepID=A0ABT0ZYN2_9PSEU|nr:hypothetical protein [Pseudonocardia humida]MCO1655858.1 hypothetical protein [Pseudonocardia humida]
MRTQEGCAGHAGLGAEVRAVAVDVLDRLEPALERVRDGVDEPGTACGACPVCAVVAAVRRDHPELAARVAEQAAGMLAALRAALEEGDPPPRPAEPPEPPTPQPTRQVQRIHVERPRAAR